MPKRISAMASAMSSTRMQRLDELGGVGQACIMAWRVLPNYCPIGYISLLLPGSGFFGRCICK